MADLTVGEELLYLIRGEMVRIADVLITQRYPEQITISPEDLNRIVTAVEALNGPVTAAEVALAVQQQISPLETPGASQAVLEALVELRKTMDRLGQIVGGMARSYGSSGPNHLTVDNAAANPVPITGTITTSTAAPTVLRYGQKLVAVTNTAIQLDTGVCSGVIVQALAGNVGNVVIGDSAVATGNGMQLQSGQASGIAIDNVNRIYVNGTAGDGVCWIGS